MSNVIFPYTVKEAKEAGIKNSSEENKKALFPKRLKECREAILDNEGKKLSQAEAAKAIGVSRSTIGLYETGDNVPDVKTIIKIAELYKVSVDYLLCLTDIKSRDFNQKEIGRITGLSDGAIKALNDNVGEKHYGNENIIGTINLILENENLPLKLPETEKEIEEWIENKMPIEIISKIRDYLLYNPESNREFEIMADRLVSLDKTSSYNFERKGKISEKEIIENAYLLEIQKRLIKFKRRYIREKRKE